MRKLVMNPVLWVAAIAAVGVAGVSAAAPASAATASAGTGTIIDYATSYTSPSKTSIAVHHLEPGEKVEAYCSREGQVLNGNPYWVAISTDGQTAYVHRSSISVPQGVLPC
jgi:hypothetical protein